MFNNKYIVIIKENDDEMNYPMGKKWKMREFINKCNLKIMKKKKKLDCDNKSMGEKYGNYLKHQIIWNENTNLKYHLIPLPDVFTSSFLFVPH